MTHSKFNHRINYNIMAHTVDLYLGTFLVLGGFVLSLFNLRRLLKENSLFSKVLISENLILTCIGIAFIIRSIHNVNPSDMTMKDIEKRLSDPQVPMECSFQTALISYGPLIISLVNSFLSLLIDNYMHYRILADTKKKEDEDDVRPMQDLREDTTQFKFGDFWKKYSSYAMLASQWAIPILLALSMYPVNIKEKILEDARDLDNSCMNMMDVKSDNCTYETFSYELRNSMSTENYLEVYEQLSNIGNNSNQFNSVLNNVYDIISNFNNDTSFNVTSTPLVRRAKQNTKCMKLCYLDNKNLLLYLFVLVIISYFVPIMISTIILTKIHMMMTKKPNIKTYVSRELLYNILFWTPVMLDTFMSVILCSYTMNGMRTSIFNVIANVYQVIKNFMNTKYFKDNAVNPIV